MERRAYHQDGAVHAVEPIVCSSVFYSESAGRLFGRDGGMGDDLAKPRRAEERGVQWRPFRQCGAARQHGKCAAGAIVRGAGGSLPVFRCVACIRVVATIAIGLFLVAAMAFGPG